MSYFRIPTLAESWPAFAHLFYPDLCVSCSAAMPSSSASCFCIPCRLLIKESNMHTQPDNLFMQRFWGRIPLKAGASMYFFSKQGPIQKALHQFKYKNQPDIGLRLGRAYGRQLAVSPLFEGIELIVPVPLHPKKERIRGYNQSAVFAKGLAESMGVPVANHLLAKDKHNDSQTRKHRIERYENVETAFHIGFSKDMEGKHVLLVDDIFTTGATLETCANALLEVKGLTISMATIAIAVHGQELF